MRTCCWLLAGAALLFASAVVADATTRAQPDAAAQLRKAVDSNELELAALVARLGDDAVLTSLAETKDVVLRLAALRATPYLANEELALQPLAAIAQGRDPDLAPAAARRALVIAQALEFEDLAARELEPAPLRAAQGELARLANAPDAHAQVRLCAGQAAHLLDVLLRPASE